MRNSLRFVRRHWGVALALLVLAIGAGAAASSPEVRDSGLHVWQHVLQWAGLAGSSTDSGQAYWCPMHPQIKSRKENAVCPICNMALVELEGGIPRAPETLTLSARQIQQAAVVTEPVIRRKLYREIDTTGRIDFDERRYAGISSWVTGKSRIDKLHVSFTGETVQKGDLIAEIYSPTLISAQEEFLTSVRAADARSRRPVASTTGIEPVDIVSSARQRLLYQGMTAEQVERLEQTRQVLDLIPVFAPISGTVIERHVQEGQYVSEGDWLFHLADLSQLWLFADIYEEEDSLVEVGQRAQLSVRGLPGEAFSGEVAFKDPVVTSESRTIRVRINVPNPDGRLKPGMFARAQLRRELPEVLAVPEDAILWSGRRAVAIVKMGDGAFQPREVRIGRRWLTSSDPDVTSTSAAPLEFGAKQQRYNEVLAGLHPGEAVVTSGAFLLSAESQFQSVLMKMLPPEDQPVTLEEAIGGSLAHGMRELLDRYYQLTSSLAEDELGAAQSSFAALFDAADQLSRNAAQENVESLSDAARQVAEHARDAASEPPGDLRDARTHYGRISRSMVQLLAENGGQTLFGRDLFLFRCGMAKVGYENWLWWSDEKFNPYMGQKMLTCGTQLEVLGP